MNAIITRARLLAACVLTLAITPAWSQNCLPFGSQSSNVITQTFPAGAAGQTAWRVTFGHAPAKGLYILGAWFQRAPNTSWIQVLYDARLSNIFVPYHPGSPRYYDLSGFNFDLVPVANVDLGPCGARADRFVVKEIRDRGMLWKDDQTGRRGHDLTLWATLDAANYNYMMLYSFRDDGSIGFRLGATARNLPGMEWVPHMHDGLWRIDIDLNGFTGDTVQIHRHAESTASNVATDSMSAFNGGKEGFTDWDPLQFTELNVSDANMRNGQGRQISYDLMVVREGTPRHLEKFSQHDFWATRYRFGEDQYTQLPTYISNGESVTKNDVVLWYISPAHHMPRSEDGRYVNGVWRGVALAMWTGFDLRPRDLFDGTPLFP